MTEILATSAIRLFIMAATAICFGRWMNSNWAAWFMFGLFLVVGIAVDYLAEK